MKKLFKTKVLVVIAITLITGLFFSLTYQADAATLKSNNVKIRIQTVLYVGDMDVIDCSEKAKITSSDKNIAYIDEDGFIVAAAPGEAVITVKDGKQTQTIEIFVPKGCIPGDHNYQTDKNGKTICSKCGNTK